MPDLPTSVLHDRAAGSLVGLAAGDALGAGYEMTTPASDADIRMIGGGLGDFAPGEWTDDTSQAVAVARVLATGELDLDAIGAGFLEWFADDPPDCGVSTRRVLLDAHGDPARLPDAARTFFERHPDSAAGNGALMRTSPVALAFLGDDDAIAAAAMEVAGLTHGDPLAGEGCVLWCIAIDRAVREGRLDGVREGLDLLPAGSRDRWASALTEAEVADPRSLRGNGFVVRAVQAAHAAIVRTPVPEDRPGRHLPDALRTAVRIGGDTDTVAAIAGQLLGAAWGVSAVPALWRTMLHGWPGLRVDDLVALAVLTTTQGATDGQGWPGAANMASFGAPLVVAHPHDPGLLLGNLHGVPGAVDLGADVVVSLCRTGTQDVPDDVEHVTVWLPDTEAEGTNPNLDLVLSDTTELVLRRRAEGHRVFLHCAAGASRTPTIAALCSAYTRGTRARDEWQALDGLLPLDPHNRRLQAALDRDVADLLGDISVDQPSA